MIEKKFIKENFYFDDDELVFFNQTMYGICPIPVLEAKCTVLREFEANPNFGFGETLFEGSLENTRILAKRLGVKVENLAVMENVTHAFCSILKSITIKPREAILLTNFTYFSIRPEVEDKQSREGFMIRILTLEPPFLSNKAIVDQYVAFVEAFPDIRYAIIEHIPSALPIVQPVQDIIQALRIRGVFVIVDGANAPGQMKTLNLEEVDADVYIGDLHKWCFLPRGTAFLALRDGSSVDVKTPIFSWLNSKDLCYRFQVQGTKDITNILCIKPAFDFIDILGGLDHIHETITRTLEKGVAYLEKAWDVKVPQFPEMAPFTRLVPLPAGFERHHTIMIQMVDRLFQRNYYKFTLEKLKFVITILIHKNQFYFRLSCHIYNNFDHFVMFSERVLLWLKMMDDGEIMDFPDRE